MAEFTDGLDDAMPTIPKDVEDVVAAKVVEHHSARTLPQRDTTMSPTYEDMLAGNMLAADDHGPEEPDMVVLPAHYARFKIEPIRFLVENFGPTILVGKVIKYTMRYDAKNGMEDLKKAERCLTMLQKYISGDPDWWQR